MCFFWLFCWLVLCSLACFVVFVFASFFPFALPFVYLLYLCVCVLVSWLRVRSCVYCPLCVVSVCVVSLRLCVSCVWCAVFFLGSCVVASWSSLYWCVRWMCPVWCLLSIVCCLLLVLCLLFSVLLHVGCLLVCSCVGWLVVLPRLFLRSGFVFLGFVLGWLGALVCFGGWLGVVFKGRRFPGILEPNMPQTLYPSIIEEPKKPTTPG